MGWMETWRVRVRIYWRHWSQCRAFHVDEQKNERGTYDAWFCTRLPLHWGEHCDERYAVARWRR